jgi:hypothetical protein
LIVIGKCGPSMSQCDKRPTKQQPHNSFHEKPRER